ncbi:MAG: hypothetical protein K9N11_07450 [Lentisphaeria bacterium]|nr:hypothetical protein [Candidatus Neomarinimicrobiota bacterium]MCF7842672.1 hypothetical protein [Lentisphaeria bacterium]
MTDKTSKQTDYQYARDDFRYPRWLTRILDYLVNMGGEAVRKTSLAHRQMDYVLWGMSLLYVIVILPGFYFWAGLLLGLWVYADQVHLRLFIEKKAPNRHLKHVLMESPFVLGLAIHFWLQGYLFTGLATLFGFGGMYLLSSMQMKYDLESLKIPKLYFLRWDRLGMLALMVILGALEGPRAYLWPVLGGWFLLALTFYDYIWVMIQFMKHGKQ